MFLTMVFNPIKNKWKELYARFSLNKHSSSWENVEKADNYAKYCQMQRLK